MERSQLVDLFEVAKQAAYTANIKGVLSCAAEVSLCTQSLKRLESLPVTAEFLDSTRIASKIQNLTQHKHVKIRSSASSLLRTWKQRIHHPRKESTTSEEPRRNPEEEKKGRIIRIKLPPKAPEASYKCNEMEKELVELFEAAKKAADVANVKGVLSSAAEVSRCTESLKHLQSFPVTAKFLLSKRITSRLEHLTHHKIVKIKSSASSLLHTWNQRIQRQGNESNTTDQEKKKRLVVRIKLPPKAPEPSPQQTCGDDCQQNG